MYSSKFFGWNSVKFLFSCITFVLCLLFLFLTFFGKDFLYTKNSVLRKEVSLGLDLKGGVQLLLEVDFDQCIEDKLNLLRRNVRESLRQEGVYYFDLHQKGAFLYLELRDSLDVPKLVKSIKSIASEIVCDVDNKTIKISYRQLFLEKLRDETIERSTEIIRRRIDAFGTKEPSIQKQGSGCLLIQVPGIKDLGSLKSVIGKTAKLSFHLVIDEKDSENSIGLVKSVKCGSQSIRIGAIALMTGDLLTEASVRFVDNRPVVAFSLNNIGARVFGDITKSYKGRQLAIVLDNEIISAPVINDHILGGSGIIFGEFDIESAQELALLLKSGALPAPLKIIEEKVIGPSLGEDSLISSKISGFIALFLVSLVMLWCYGILGAIAVFSLFATIAYILSILILFQITLTLPGIAGIILTLGMAVDANILVYEHIKEELRMGVSSLSAVKRGFKISYKTILDANLTSLIAAVLLYIFGIGAVKGFAVTFGLGIFASMFACFWISQPLVNAYYRYCINKV